MNTKSKNKLLKLAIFTFGLLIFSCAENSKEKKKEIAPENIMTELKKHNLPEYFEELIEKERLYLKKTVLDELTTGIPNKEYEYYFSKTDFELVLSRVEKLNIGIVYIDVYKNEEIIFSEFPEDYDLKANDPNWYKTSFKKITGKTTELKINTTFELPNEILDSLMER